MAERKFIATEQCVVGSRWYNRGDIVIADAKTKHHCLVPYDGADMGKKATEYYDPMAQFISDKRLAEVTGRKLEEIQKRGVVLDLPAGDGKGDAE